MDEDIPLFSIIIKSDKQISGNEEGPEDKNENNIFIESASDGEVVLSDGLHSSVNEDSDLNNVSSYDDSNSRQDFTEESNSVDDPKKLYPAKQTQCRSKQNYIPADVLRSVEAKEKEYDTEEVSSDELSFDEKILERSNLVSTVAGFEVYSVPLNSVCEMWDKPARSHLSSVATIEGYKNQLREFKRRGARYRKKIRLLEEECDGLKEKIDTMKNVILETKKNIRKPHRNVQPNSNASTLEFFEMDSDDDMDSDDSEREMY